MRIVHICTSDNDGGAARAAYRLHSGLLEININSQMFVLKKYSGNESVIQYRHPSGSKKVLSRIYKRCINSDFNKYESTRPAGLEVFSDDRSTLKYGFFEQLPSADIYNLHWISGFVDLPSFFRKIRKPLVWTLHDMFPFTGGCHYSNSCEKFQSRCGKCPQLGSVVLKDLAGQIWSRKQESLAGFRNKIIIRADSEWLAGEARKSSLLRDMDIGTIHYGIETDEFIPRNKNACRDALGIPQTAKVIVFGAPDISNPRKGYSELKQALLEVYKNQKDLFLLSFGAGKYTGVADVSGLHLGHISNNQMLSVVYNCADVFVIPSLQEAFGQTALEAMSCGIPVVGFNTGGIPDMIENYVTGYLSQTGNISELADNIDKILSLDLDSYNRYSTSCRNKVLKEFTIQHQAESYKYIYFNIK